MVSRIRNTIQSIYMGYRAVNYKVRSSPMSPLSDFPEVEAEIYKIIQSPPHIESSIYGCSTPEVHKICSPIFSHPVIATYSNVSENSLNYSVYSCEEAKRKWKNEPINNKLDMFLTLADLIETKYWNQMMASTIVCQGKSVYEAEIDCIGELADFLRFNVQYAVQMIENQPLSSLDTWNITKYLPLQGVVASITPFNFTAIAGNLATAPLLFGNIVYWKPSYKSLLSNKLVYDICLEAGFPKDVLHFIIIEPQKFIEEVIKSDRLGGVLYTGSTQHLHTIHSNVYNNIGVHYPRIIGETGGKNYHFVDNDANIDLVVNETFKSAFGYSGQKCSSCSRLYLPEHMLGDFLSGIRKKIIAINKEEYGVIDKDKFEFVCDTIHYLRQSEKSKSKILFGGSTDDSVSYYIEPTIYISETDENPLLSQELFAPLLGIRLYSGSNRNMIYECASASDYALTGSLFSENEKWLENTFEILEETAGNFYINKKSTGAIVGQQPFGGFKLSGTNDKAGGSLFLSRLCQQQTVSIRQS